MNIQFHFKHINPVLKPDVEAYVQAKLDDLERYMPEGANRAAVTIEHFEKHDAYCVDIRLLVRSGREVMVQAEETKHTYTESVDAVKDKLQMQILKMKDKILEAERPKALAK